MPNNTHSATLAGIGGTLLQWYDFSLFGFFTPIIAKQFFPHTNYFVALLSTFGVFAVGFLLAPLGAIFFGHFGDKYGRKTTLTLTVLCMAMPTFFIAFIPSYQTIGITAPLLLTLLRLIQGFVASAEFASSAVFMVEHAPPGKESFFGSLTSSSYSIGMILGAIVASIATLHFMPVWAWRVPFGLALVGALLVMYLRTRVNETPVFSQIKQLQKVARTPILQAFKNDRQAFFTTVGMAWFIGVITYGSYVFMVTYLHLFSKLSISTAILFVSIALAVDACTQPFFAFYADKIGRRKILTFGSLLLIALITPIFYGLSSGLPWLILLSIILLSLLIAFTYSPVNAFLTLQFSPENRVSGFSVAFNIGITIFGATTPLVLTALIYHFGHHLAPIFYYLLAAGVGLTAIKFSETITAPTLTAK